MKALVCELCGSNDMLKQDGVFVCQYCGTKYTLEDARKLMLEIDGPVEVKGTVKVDNTAQINNYLSMAKSAYDGKDIDGVVKYCDKVLELDPNNYEAWVYRAKSACWNSSLNDIKIPQSIIAAKKAVELAPNEKKSLTADDIYWELKKTIETLLSFVYRMPLTVGVLYAHNVMTQWGEMLTSIPCLSKELIQKELADCKSTCETSKKAIMPSKRYVYAAYIGYNGKESYDVTFSGRCAANAEKMNTANVKDETVFGTKVTAFSSGAMDIPKRKGSVEEK